MRDIRPLFRPKDVDHMRPRGTNLTNLEDVRDFGEFIVDLVQHDRDDRRMPKPPGQRWTPTQVQLVQQWIDERFPP